jgi:hypothetical protein
MTSTAVVVGIDPGPPGRYGTVLLRTYVDRMPLVHVLDYDVVDDWLSRADLVALERFVIGHGTVRRTRVGTDDTLACIAHVREVTRRAGVRLVELPAGIVKPWATDERLALWGLSVKGDHHRDATRHALYAAVRTGLLPHNPKGLV